ncbi:MAG: phosphatidate cytidylyltransferase [Bacteroidaceae bacterium]|nr:phosphatidate cytidylyltransferase [Bacteroidaceae bacterium]
MTPKQHNLIVRSLAGIVFLTIMVGGIVYGPLSMGLLFTLITALSVREFCHIVSERGDVSVNSFICSVSGAYLFLAFFGYMSGLTPTPAVFIPYLISIIYLLVSELYLQRESPINNWACTMMSQMYVALPFSLMPVLAFLTDPAHPGMGVCYRWIFPLSVFIFLWTSDTGAYCFGSLFGRHRLFERISPKKSWEGSVGGAFVTVVAAYVIARFDQSLTLPQWIGFALVVVVFGMWGDLVESLLKRQLGIKDSGNVIPGHGGMLDRFDSSLLAIPAAVVYLYTLTIL